MTDVPMVRLLLLPARMDETTSLEIRTLLEQVRLAIRSAERLAAIDATPRALVRGLALLWAAHDELSDQLRGPAESRMEAGAA